MNKEPQTPAKATVGVPGVASGLSIEALEEMRRTPQKGWSIADIERICNRVGANFSAPTRGSHYKVSSPHLPGILTIPFKRPIKPIYVKKFVALIDAHLEHRVKEQSDG